MTEVTLEQRAAIGDAVHRFYDLVDRGQASRTAELFADDAKLTFGPRSPKPGTIEGAAIRDAMIAREAQTSAFTRHAVSNFIFARSDDAVAVRYLLTLYRSDDETRGSVPAFVADVEERWREASSGWRIAERTIVPAFVRS
jgi:ketosteroid isomerase-like protein